MSRTNAITDEEYNRIMNTGRDISLSVYRAELPKTIHGFSTQRKDGKYMIFLNSTESEAGQTATFLHECLHILHNDHENNELTASEIETIRHKETAELLELLKTRE